MYKLKETQGKRKLFSTLASLNFGALCMGMTLGSTESSLTYFIVPADLYQKTSQNDQIIQTSMTMGVALGALLPVFFADIYGRKTSFAISAIINTFSWIILAVTKSRTANITAGFVAGCSGGIFQTTVALYVPEISLPKNRSTVGVFIVFCSSIGVVLTNIIIIATNFKIFAAGMMILLLTFLWTVIFYMIESPYFLYQQSKVLEAKLSLKALRGAQTYFEVDEEFSTLRNFFHMNQIESDEMKLLNVFLPRKSKRKKSLALVLILLFVSQLVAEYAMDDYAMEMIDAKIPHYGEIIFSCLDVISIGICFYVVEKIGRKFLLNFSVIGLATMSFTLAIYQLALQKECEETYHYIGLRVTMIVIYHIVYSLGLIPILPILGGEIFSFRIKTIAVGLSMMFVYLIAGGMQQLYCSLKRETGVCLAFATFTLLGSIGLPIAVLALPETLGKSLYQIQGEIEDVAMILS